MPGGGAAEGFVEWNGDGEVEFGAGASDVRDVAVKGSVGVGGAVDLDGESWVESGGGEVGGLGDGHADVGAYVVGPAGLAVGEERPEPDGEVGHVEPGAAGGAVALDVDGLVVERRAEEVTNGEVGVEREMRADEGEATGDDRVEFGVGLAEVFSGALGGLVGVERELGGGEGFGGMEEGGGAAVDCASGGIEESVGTGVMGEVEDVAGAGEDVVVEVFGGTGGLLAARVGGGGEDGGVGFGGEGEGADVAFEERDGGAVGDVRGFCAEGGDVAGEDRGAQVEVEFAVGVEEGFEEPVSEEAGATGDEDAGVAEGEEGRLGVGEDVGEVFGGQRFGEHRNQYALDVRGR